MPYFPHIAGHCPTIEQIDLFLLKKALLFHCPEFNAIALLRCILQQTFQSGWDCQELASYLSLIYKGDSLVTMLY